MNMRGLPAIQYFVSGGQIDKIYQDLFGRAPDEGGKSFYQDLLAGRSLSDAYAIIGGGATGEDASKAPPEKIAEKTVEAAYRQELGRAPDLEGKQNYIEQALQGNVSLTDLDSIFRSSPEFTSKTEFINLPSTGGGGVTETSMADAVPLGPGITPTKVTQPPVKTPTPPVKTLTPLEQLYFDILGRAGDASGLGYYGPKFGDVIDASERELFIRNAVKSGELTQAQADALLGTTTGAPVDAPTAARPEDMLNRLLYQPILGRTGEPGGMDFYQQQFLGEGDTTISPAEREQFIRSAVQSGELSQRAANAYLGTIPGLPSFLPAGAAAVGRVDPNFLRTAAPAIATNPITGQPQLQGPTSLIQGTTPVAPPVAGMAEGGNVETAGSRALAPAEIGSRFDVEGFKDAQGRLVSGYSRPIRDEFGTILGYEDRPYEEDVVFGEGLRRREAAARSAMTDEERQMALLDMMARQGRTGVSPITGGLAGIQVGGPMMRGQPQYYSTIEAGRRYRGFAEGGLANAAQNLAARGRYGDSTLVHMAPEELSGLRALARAQGTDMTINPRTGLPEAFSLKKLFKAASFILPFVPIPGLFGMSSLLTKSIFSGIAAGASAKGGFDLKQALGGGLRAYALGSLGEKMGGAPTPGGAPTALTTTVGEAAGAVDAATVAAPQVTVPGIDGDISLAGSYTGPGSTPLGPQSLSAELTAPLKVGSGYTDVAAAPIFDAPIGTAGGPDIPVTGGSLPPGADTVPGRMSSVVTPEGQGFGKPITKGFDIAAAGIGGLSLEKAAEETRRAEIEAAAVKREEEERERRFEELARRTLGRVAVKSGGQINLAKGGMTYMEGGGTTDVTGEPRMVQGTGDGMSDSVPATIEGVQEARLANDEFVIPADVVADIGNGSSNAGAKKLYDMMDRIRKARHGTTKQPPEIKAERLMPA